MNILAILRGTFRYLSTTIVDYFELRQSLKTLTIAANARYRQLEHTIMLMSTLAILRGTFGNFRLLRLALIFIINVLLITSNARYGENLNVFASFAQNRRPINLKRASSCLSPMML